MSDFWLKLQFHLSKVPSQDLPKQIVLYGAILFDMKQFLGKPRIEFFIQLITSEKIFLTCLNYLDSRDKELRRTFFDTYKT